MFSNSLKYSFIALICIGLFSSVKTYAGGSYRAYAAKMMSSLPAGSRVRPDLEAYLDGLATSARRKEGRSALKSSTLLKGAARGQAAEMVLGNFVGHHSSGGYRFKSRFAAYAGKDFRGLHGENAARQRAGGAPNKAKARKLFQQWMNSRGHRRNLLNRAYKFVSTGVIQKGNHLYAVQVFWEPQGKKQQTNILVIN